MLEAYQLGVYESKKEAVRSWLIPAVDGEMLGIPSASLGAGSSTAHDRLFRRSCSAQDDKSCDGPSGFALDLGPPPADANEQETPVAEELRGLAFEGVADELEKPSEEEKTQSVGPQAMDEDAGYKYRDREDDGRDAQGVAEPVHAVLMAGGVLGDPLLVGAIAQHAEDDTTAGGALHGFAGGGPHIIPGLNPRGLRRLLGAW